MKTALYLAPGASRAAYQVGAIDALMQEGITFDVIGACSVGALNGSFVAMGEMAPLIEVWSRWETRDVMRTAWGRIFRGAFFWARSLMTNEPEHRSAIDPYVRESKLTPGVRFRFNLANLTTGGNVILEYPGHPFPLAQAVGASVAVPVVFPPEPFDGDELSDGLTIHGFGLEELVMSTGVERVFVVAVAPRTGMDFCHSVMEIAMRAGDWNQHDEVRHGLAEVEATNRAIAEWQDDREAARQTIVQTVDDTALREDLLAELDRQYASVEFPYARNAVQIIPILPDQDLNVRVTEFKAARSRELIELGRRDARRVLQKIGVRSEGSGNREAGSEVPT